MSKIDKKYFPVLSRSSALQAGRLDGFLVPEGGANAGLDFSSMAHADKIALFHQNSNFIL